MNDEIKNKTFKIQSNYIIITAIIAVIFSIIIFVFTHNTPSQNSINSSSLNSSSSTSSTIQVNTTEVDNNEVTTKTENSVAMAGSYKPYSETLLADVKTERVVIFFNANWCSSCQRTVKDINANLGNISSNVTILSADYDKEIALRRKYGVTTQHTFVQVDKNGNLIKKEIGLNTLQDINNFVKQ